jgi:hypothetical protein
VVQSPTAPPGQRLGGKDCGNDGELAGEADRGCGGIVVGAVRVGSALRPAGADRSWEDHSMVGATNWEDFGRIQLR